MPPDRGSTPREGRPRLAVDWIRCEGYGVCGDLLPELIDLDDWRYPVLRAAAIPPERMHDAQRAIDCCPMKALRLARDRHAE